MNRPVHLALIGIFFLLSGCFSKSTLIDDQKHLFKSKEAGIEITFPSQWQIASSKNSLFTADLKTDAAAFEAHRGGGGPADAIGLAACGEPVAVFTADHEGGLFHLGNNYDALRAIQ